MNNTELREMQKGLVEGWFTDYYVLEFKGEIPFKSVYSHFMGYCDFLAIQVMSKKIFSILLRESLRDSISNGYIQVKPLVNNIYKGIGLKPLKDIF